MNTDQIIDILCKGKDEERMNDFLQFLSNKLWNLYNSYLMDQILIIENEVNSLTINLPNAKENKPYDYTYVLPDNQDKMCIIGLEGLTSETHGLSLKVAEDGRSFSIHGTPSLDALRADTGKTIPSIFELVLTYKYSGVLLPEDRPNLERHISFVINQDPRKLWKNLPVNWEGMPSPKYENTDTQTDYVKVEASPAGKPQKDMVAASKRGRSHAQEAKPRDDFFKLSYLENGWYIMAVADGAGSAKLSRAGSRLACETSVNYIASQLINNPRFEEEIDTYNLFKEESESEARKLVGDYIYNIVGMAAFRAHKAIKEEADAQMQPLKSYATTLLLAICKQFSYGWFIASFWVGDGAICLYDQISHTAKMLGTPDEGEYAGQTRFLTMPEIFKDGTALYQRLRFQIIPDFTALFLMTDGVSDPKFETDANLNNPAKWDALWNDLSENGVELSDDNEAAKEQLLQWLDFWSPGNHDDRTIAILY